MSGLLAGLSTGASFAQQGLSAAGLMPAFIRNTRRVGAIIPDVTIEEQHSDRLQVTQHPVARGSPVSDHAFKLPATVTMRMGWTNANPVGSAVQGFQAGGGFENIGGGLLGAGKGLLSSATEQRVRDIYDGLIKLQYDKEEAAKGGNPVQPFQLTTGKRTYENMVIVELGVRTDHTTEYSLMIECHMQEVFIVETQTTTQPAQSDQAKPESTQATTAAPDKKTDTPTERTSTPLADLKQKGMQALHGLLPGLF
jgi:hypothetical protein